nr:hypothetical protein [Sphingomonas sp. Y57]
MARLSVLAGLAAVVISCGDAAIACELTQRTKSAGRIAQPARDLFATLQKRLEDLLRPASPSSTPSRRIILQ